VAFSRLRQQSVPEDCGSLSAIMLRALVRLLILSGFVGVALAQSATAPSGARPTACDTVSIRQNQIEYVQLQLSPFAGRPYHDERAGAAVLAARVRADLVQAHFGFARLGRLDPIRLCGEAR
jgi:hypothetical protein